MLYRERKEKNMGKKRSIWMVAVLLMVLIVLTGCGGNVVSEPENEEYDIRGPLKAVIPEKGVYGAMAQETPEENFQGKTEEDLFGKEGNFGLTQQGGNYGMAVTLQPTRKLQPPTPMPTTRITPTPPPLQLAQDLQAPSQAQEVPCQGCYSEARKKIGKDPCVQAGSTPEPGDLYQCGADGKWHPTKMLPQ